MFDRRTGEQDSVLAPTDRADLEDARATHKRLLSRADVAIQQAMAHADEVFGYRGPDRRRRPR
jgi:hypothetical protein